MHVCLRLHGEHPAGGDALEIPRLQRLAADHSEREAQQNFLRVSTQFTGTIEIRSGNGKSDVNVHFF